MNQLISGWPMLHDSPNFGACRLQHLADHLGKGGGYRQYVPFARKEGGLERTR